MPPSQLAFRRNGSSSVDRAGMVAVSPVSPSSSRYFDANVSFGAADLPFSANSSEGGSIRTVYSPGAAPSRFFWVFSVNVPSGSIFPDAGPPSE
jgi:hypothetical protein